MGHLRPAPSLRAVMLIGAISLSGLTGCGGGSGSSTPTATATKAPAAANAAATQGKALYTAKGCQSCHSIDGSSGTGPTWKGLAGSPVKLTTGRTVTAGNAYLLLAIENPDKQIVAGYQPGIMSGSIPKGSISATDAAKLVAYIKSLH